MNINDILDTIDEMLDKAWGLPLSGGRCVVDAEQLRDLMSEIRLNMPGEIKQAKLIVADRVQILNDAKAESEQIIRAAQARAKILIENEEIYKKAAAKANDMITAAQQQTRELKRSSNEFVDNSLRETEEKLLKNLAAVRESRQVLRKMGK